MSDTGINTRLVHADRRFGVEHGGVRKPIHTSVQYGFDTVEELVGVFQGTVKGYNYARQGTPTSAALEAKITRLEQGIGSICFATGMAAITATCRSTMPRTRPPSAPRAMRSPNSRVRCATV